MKTLLKLSLIAAIALAITSCGGKTRSQKVNYQHKRVIAEAGQSESPEEQAACEAAYQFVMGIVNENYSKVVDLMSLDYFFQWMPALIGEWIPMEQIFSSDHTHTIVDMRPVVKLGYEVLVVDYLALDSKACFEEGSAYRKQPAYSVTFDCFDANNKKYDGSQGEYDTDVTVRVVMEDGEWKVFGFE